MRLHTDKVTEADLADAAQAAGVELHRATRHGSWSRNHAFEVTLEGSGREGGAYGNVDGRVGTWDEWGMFLAHLYRIDTDMIAGPYQHNREDEYESFDFLTGDRYRDLTPKGQHKRHKWEPNGIQPTYCFMPGTVASYVEHECNCGAIMRRILDYVGEDGTVTRKRPARMLTS